MKAINASSNFEKRRPPLPLNRACTSEIVSPCVVTTVKDPSPNDNFAHH